MAARRTEVKPVAEITATKVSPLIKAIIEEAEDKIKTKPEKFTTIFDALMDSAGYDCELFDRAIVVYATDKLGITATTPHDFWKRYNQWKREAGCKL